MFAFYGKLKTFSAIAGMTAPQSHISAWQITLAPIVTSPPIRACDGRRPGAADNRNAQPRRDTCDATTVSPVAMPEDR